MVNLEEGTTRGAGTDRPDRPHRSPEGCGETFDLHCGPVPEASASADVAAAHRQGLVQAFVQRGLPSGLQVRVGFDPEGHFNVSRRKLPERTVLGAEDEDVKNELLSFWSLDGSAAESHLILTSCET